MEKRRKIQNSGGRIEDTTSIVPSNFIECNDDRSVIELRSGEGRKSHGTSPRSGKSMTESQSDTNGMKRIYVLQPRFIFHRFAFIPRFHLRDSGRYPPPYLVAGAVSFHFILFFHSNSIPSPLPTHTNQLETIERGGKDYFEVELSRMLMLLFWRRLWNEERGPTAFLRSSQA